MVTGKLTKRGPDSSEASGGKGGGLSGHRHSSSRVDSKMQILRPGSEKNDAHADGSRPGRSPADRWATLSGEVRSRFVDGDVAHAAITTGAT